MKNNKNILTIILSLFGSLFLTGCYTDFTPDIEANPVLCINSLITAGEPIVVDVTRSWIYTDVKGEKEHIVEDAVVTIYVDGKITGNDFIPKEGDEIRICVHSNTYGDAEASVMVPFAPAVTEVTSAPVLSEGKVQDYEESFMTTLSFDVGLSLTVIDDAQALNYYHYDLECYSANLPPLDSDDGVADDVEIPFCYLSEGRLKYEAEPIFSEHISEVDAVLGAEVDGFTFFTDRQFSGSRYRMNILYQNAQAIVKCFPYNIREICDAGFVICLSSVSESYYNWFSYAWQSYSGSIGDLSHIGLAEPLKGYSNVSTGAGVVAARAVTKVKVPLDEFLTKYVETALDKLNSK